MQNEYGLTRRVHCPSNIQLADFAYDIERAEDEFLNHHPNVEVLNFYLGLNPIGKGIAIEIKSGEETNFELSLVGVNG